MRSKQLALAVSLVVVAVLGCEKVKSLYRGQTDPLVGTWRLVGEESGESMTFEADGTFRAAPGRIDPALGEDMAKLMRVISAIPGRFSRGADVIVVSYDLKALRKATADLPKRGPGMTGETVDEVVPYKLSGDVLETTKNGKTSRYVRKR